MTSHRLDVGLAARTYPIHIAPGLLADEALWAPWVEGRSVVLVTNETVMPLYGEALVAMLGPRARSIHTHVLPDGEAHKTLAHFEAILSTMLAAHCDRKTRVVALGGGVVGDMAGFAAACYQRGVDVLQVPTTLLSQVDSSVGGKTAVNHPLGKNMIGAFHQPSAVFIDLHTLATLPERELSAGLAEVIKYGCILDLGFFEWLEANMSRLMARDPDALAHAVRRSCELKAEVVAGDERETSGLRALLNFGHTFGHAIEAGLGFGTWLHGEAVGCGMVMAAELSQELGQLGLPEVQRIRALVRAAGLPITPPAWDASTFLDWMAHDKKADAGAIRYIVLRGLGSAELRPVPAEVVARAIGASQATA